MDARYSEYPYWNGFSITKKEEKAYNLSSENSEKKIQMIKWNVCSNESAHNITLYTLLETNYLVGKIAKTIRNWSRIVFQELPQELPHLLLTINLWARINESAAVNNNMMHTNLSLPENERREAYYNIDRLSPKL